MAKKYIDVEPFENALMAVQKRSDVISIAEVLNTLMKYPAADVVEVKHGHWVKRWNTWFKCDVPVCSVCGNGEIFKTDYCPECGAKMDEVEGEQNG